MTTLGITLMAVGILLWLVDRWRPSAPASFSTASVGDVLEAVKDLPMPRLVFAGGFLVVLLDQGWIAVSAGAVG